jgi:hypothetical protein
MARRIRGATAIAGIALALALGWAGSAVDGKNGNVDVFAGFDLGSPQRGPFPSDIFTVPDPTQNSGRRLNYPYPDCTVRPSDCDDLEVVNTLDGWGLQSRVSIPFSDEIDVATVNSDSVFVLSLDSTRPGQPPGGERIGVNQIVWDVATHTLHFEVDRLLDQHRRYAVIVTKDVLTMTGKRVQKTSAFETYASAAPAWYAEQLKQALAAAHALGVPPGHVVTASVFTTQTITSVMERIRDDIRAATPAPADFQLGPSGERAVFARTDVASITWRQHTKVNPDDFTDTLLNLGPLQNIPNTVGVIAFGRYLSPDYTVHPGEYIPAVGTLAGTPPVTAQVVQYFTLTLPAGPKPATGWPIAMLGGGATGNQHQSPILYASKLAQHGIATIGINHYGQGFGPLGSLTIRKTDLTSLMVPDAGRGIDQNNDSTIGSTEGSDAARPRLWTIAQRDAHRQTVIDFMQLARVIEMGMDVDGDAVADIDPARIYYGSISAGSMIGTILLALDPSIKAGVLASAPGLVPESVRWQPVRRTVLGGILASRTPSLINVPGLEAIDGVATQAPRFNENKPLRDQPPVINTVAGAMDLQQALEFAELVQENGLTPVTWARYVRTTPLPGLYPKAVIYQFAKGDQNATNPGTSALIREGNLEDRTLYYRHDLAFATDPTMPTNPHLFGGMANFPNATFRAVARGAQDQMGVFFASGGITIIHPSPQAFFETPIAGPLPEILNFIK